MPIVKSTEVTFGHPDVTRVAYNALDCAVTREVFDKLRAEFGNDEHNRKAVYQFEMDLQAPALDMTFRGIKVDQVWRERTRRSIEADIARLQEQLDFLAEAVWDKGLNPRSPKQLQEFFYGALGLKPIRVPAGRGEWKVTVNDEALNRLEVYPRAVQFVQHIKQIRKLGKDLSVVKTAIDRDGRFRAGYRVAGTETGRWASSKNAFGTGSNAQNITDKMRRMFVPDEGMKLCYADLEQAESRIVGIIAGTLFDEWTYYEACLSGDLHTLVTKMVWQDLPWTGDPKKDRAIADLPAFGRHSYRDLAKRLGHGSNYSGGPRTLAKHAGIPERLAKDFQRRYYSAFPGIRMYGEWVKKQLKEVGYLTTPLGRTRHFFDRPDNPDTIRKAIAFVPQSSIGDLLNRALLELWKAAPDLGIELLAQVHDAILFQYPSKREHEIIPKVVDLMQVPFEYGGRSFTIPVEAAVGWNWAHKSKDNPNGIDTYVADK